MTFLDLQPVVLQALHGRDGHENFLVSLRERIEALACRHQAASWD